MTFTEAESEGRLLGAVGGGEGEFVCTGTALRFEKGQKLWSWTVVITVQHCECT